MKKLVNLVSVFLVFALLMSLVVVLPVSAAGDTTIYANWDGSTGLSGAGVGVNEGNAKVSVANQPGFVIYNLNVNLAPGSYKVTAVMSVDKSTIPAGSETAVIARFNPFVINPLRSMYPNDMTSNSFASSNVYQAMTGTITIGTSDLLSGNTTAQTQIRIYSNGIGVFRVAQLMVTGVGTDSTVYSTWTGAEGTSFVTGNTIENNLVRKLPYVGPSGTGAQEGWECTTNYTMPTAGDYKITVIMQIDKSTGVAGTQIRFNPRINGTAVFPKDINDTDFGSSNTYQFFSAKISTTASNQIIQPRFWFNANATIRIKQIILSGADFVPLVAYSAIHNTFDDITSLFGSGPNGTIENGNVTGNVNGVRIMTPKTSGDGHTIWGVNTTVPAGGLSRVVFTIAVDKSTYTGTGNQPIFTVNPCFNGTGGVSFSKVISYNDVATSNFWYNYDIIVANSVLNNPANSQLQARLWYYNNIKVTVFKVAVYGVDLTVPAPDQINLKPVKITNNVITGISPNNSLATFGAEIYAGDAVIAATDHTGATPLGANDKIGTGTKLSITANSVTSNYTILLYGDVDGNGLIDVTDLTLMKSHLLKSNLLSGVFVNAGDISKEGNITISDLLAIKKSLLGLSSISQ